jgi:multidrug efflux pump subunit AcrA (membrane-fusion protein)
MEIMKYARWYTGALVVLAFILGACSPAPATPAAADATPLPPSAVVAEGHIVPASYTSLSFLAPGVIQEVNVKQGDQVKQGDVLMRLNNAGQVEAQVVTAQQAYDALLRTAPVDRARLWQAYIDTQKVREAAQKKWNDINLRDIENRIEDRQNDLADRQADLDKAQAAFDAVKDRGRDDANYKREEDDLDHARADYDEALKELESTMRERDVPRAGLDAALAAEAEAKYQYELTADGPNADRLALAKAQLDAAQSLVTNYVLTAPFDGVVMDVNAAPGDQASPQVFAIKLADTSAWYVETSDLTELEVVKVSLDQPAVINPDALPDVSLTGKVSSISQAAVPQSGDMLYRVKIKLDTIDERLLWGMTVEVIFEPEP